MGAHGVPGGAVFRQEILLKPKMQFWARKEKRRPEHPTQQGFGAPMRAQGGPYGGWAGSYLHLSSGSVSSLGGSGERDSHNCVFFVLASFICTVQPSRERERDTLWCGQALRTSLHPEVHPMGFLGPQGFCWVSMGPNLDQSGAPWDSYGASMEHHGPLGPEGAPGTPKNWIIPGGPRAPKYSKK